MRRTSMQLAAAVLAGGLAVAACGESLQLGAAATTGQSRITSVTLTNQVANLNAAYRADKHKGVKPQRAGRPGAAAGADLAAHLPDLRQAGPAARHQRHHGAGPATSWPGCRRRPRSRTVSTGTYVSAAGRGAAGPAARSSGRYFAILHGVREPAGRRQAADRAGRADGAADPGGARAVPGGQGPRHQRQPAVRRVRLRARSRWSRRRASWPAASSISPIASASPSAKPRLTPPC